MYLAISATAPFYDLIILSPDHCLWVDVLDALDLMVPLLKRHFGLPRSGIPPKSVNSGGTHPQPSHKCAEEVDDICISPRGTCSLAMVLLLSLIMPLPHDPCQFPCHPRGLQTALV